MKFIKTSLRIVVAIAAALGLTACSKTVQWEEQVLLNIGETIWVKRTVVYTAQGGAGNPFDVKYRPERNYKIAFSWRGKAYAYSGPGGFKVLAISPSGVPVLVKNADAGAWDATAGYKCTIPFYVQFVPDSTGAVWTWPPKIEAWLYGLPTNLLLDIDDPKKMLPRYSSSEKMKQSFLSDPRLLFMQKIDPQYSGDLCKTKEK